MTDDVREQTKALVAALQARGQKIHTEVGKAVLRAGLMVEREWKIGMTNTPTYASGFSYESAETGKMQSHGKGVSIPGNPAAVQTGRYRASVTHYLTGGGYGDKTVCHVATPLMYPFYLEFGTSRMMARPSATPALEKNRKAIIAMIKSATAAAVAGKEASDA